MNTHDITLIPYLHFEGDCEEALNRYKEILGGKIEIRNRYDNPNMDAPENYKDKVLHARFHFGENTIMASDVFPGQSAEKSSGDVALSVTIDDLEKAEKIFKELAEGGAIGADFEKQFWGEWHGNLTDRHGIRWMVNYEE